MDFEKMQNSLLKNFGEFTEFCVSELDVTNYYDLVDTIIDLYNFKVKVHQKDKKLYNQVINELKKEDE